MTTTHYIVYGGIFFAIAGALLIGKSLDKQQSNDYATWKTGCIGFKTIFQSVVLGLVVGPIVYLIKGRQEELWFCIVAMMAAPFIVDLLRPTVTIHGGKTISQEAASKLNTAHVLAIVICVAAIGIWAFIALTSPDLTVLLPGSCATCKP